MGWSCTRKAAETLEAIETACAATRPPEMTTSNMFFTNGKQYFYEVSRRDQTDGGIAGIINLTWTENWQDWCRQVGSFRIDGQGTVVRGPALFRKARR